MSRSVVVDIETNRAHDKIWCAVVLEVGGESQPTVCTSPEQLALCLARGQDYLVGHNIIAFDAPVLRECWGIDLCDYGVLRDTLIMGRLLYPSVSDGHSLRAWCLRTGQEAQKDSFSDFDAGLSKEMIDYCIQDCRANAELYLWMITELVAQRFKVDSMHLEHDIARIIDRQKRKGFLIDGAGAMELYNQHEQRMEEIIAEMQEVFPPVVHERWSEKTGKRLKDRIETFNPGSRQHIARRLQAMGVKFRNFTPTGQPQVSETDLEEIDLPEAKLCAEYLTLQKRLGMVKSWLDHQAVDERVHGSVLTNGAVTGRMTHTAPNMAQIPRLAEYRRLFIVPEGYKLVGCDAQGLELRMLAHYMQDDAYTAQVLEGDIHSYNQEMAGLPERYQAKTFIYAFLYGAGDAKIGQIVGGNAKDGARLKEKFLAEVPALAKLLAKLKTITKNSKTKDYKGEEVTSVPGLDGRRIWIRHEHAALNSLLQGAGAVVMKKALVIADAELQKRGLEYEFVANVHDEWQVEARADHAEEVGQVLEWAIAEAGRQLDMRCPLAGESKVGDNWSETH